jgi:hypothetical protein
MTKRYSTSLLSLMTACHTYMRVLGVPLWHCSQVFYWLEVTEQRTAFLREWMSRCLLSLIETLLRIAIALHSRRQSSYRLQGRGFARILRGAIWLAMFKGDTTINVTSTRSTQQQ